MSSPVASASTPKVLPERHRHGRRAEDAATEHLLDQGFSILGRNVRIGPLEIDIVARRSDLVVIAEVRARGATSYEKPLASISRTKIRALMRAARGIWRGRLSKMRGVQRMRIDILAVTRDAAGNETLEWIQGAITENDAR